MNRAQEFVLVLKLVLGLLATMLLLSGSTVFAQDQPLLAPLTDKLWPDRSPVTVAIKIAASNPAKAPPLGFTNPGLEITKPTGPRLAGRWRFALDRPPLALGLLQGGAELFDGIGTHRFVHAPLCRTCKESDPVCRLFLGPRPTWPRMLTLGTIEDLGATYLHQHLRHSRHRLLRWLAPAAPLTLIAIHLDQGLGVYTASTNPCTDFGPGYIVVAQMGDQASCRRPVLPVQAGPPYNVVVKRLK